jgi:hypothetical protein
LRRGRIGNRSVVLDVFDIEPIQKVSTRPIASIVCGWMIHAGGLDCRWRWPDGNARWTRDDDKRTARRSHGYAGGSWRVLVLLYGGCGFQMNFGFLTKLQKLRKRISWARSFVNATISTCLRYRTYQLYLLQNCILLNKNFSAVPTEFQIATTSTRTSIWRPNQEFPPSPV